MANLSEDHRFCVCRFCFGNFYRIIRGLAADRVATSAVHKGRKSLWLRTVHTAGTLVANPPLQLAKTAMESLVVKPLPRLRLQGFNNLTKALSFNIYDICYAVSEEQRGRYIEYIDEQYDADRLTQILTDVAEIIGANILNIARQDYDPQGASVTILISEEPVLQKLGRDTISGAVVAHMDKSHITVHTYPETHPHNGIATFRADIDVATCGVISPLKALNYLIDSFESDIVVCDYRVRGFTRDVKGKKHFIDHKINSVQDYLARHIRQKYEMFDVNVYQENMFHTKMHIKDFDLDTYLFESHADDLSFKERQRIESLLRREIEELFHGRNLM
jgi:S-adenosylmethionine decarboxylase